MENMNFFSWNWFIWFHEFFFCLDFWIFSGFQTLIFLNHCIFTAEKLKREFDNRFGAPWHVIVGEAYSFNIDYDFHFLYYFLYGPIAILVWRVSTNFFFLEYFSRIYFLKMFDLGLYYWEFDKLSVLHHPQNL